jgi:DNA-binding response OmpR family regulator
MAHVVRQPSRVRTELDRSAEVLLGKQSNPPRILLVDDDRDYRLLVRLALEKAGLCVSEAHDGASAVAVLEEPQRGPRIDLILLDVNMPGQSGWDVLARWRVHGRGTPVIFLTGVDQVDERVRGLNLGADDYVVKSLDFKELVARIEAVLRRHRAASMIVHGDVEIDVVRRLVRRGSRLLDLSPREFELLRVLASEPIRVCSRAELLDAVWNIRFDPETNVVNVHIARLRRKLEVLGPPLIHTVRGEGYVFALERPSFASGDDGGEDPEPPLAASS